MTPRDDVKIELNDFPDYDRVLQANRDLRDSLMLNDDEMEMIAGENPETFDDVSFDLIPSFDDASAPDKSPDSHQEAAENKDDPLNLAFTLREKDEMPLPRMSDMTRPILFRLSPDGDLWIVDQPDESLFRFACIREGRVPTGFTVPRGMEEFSVGFPGALIVGKSGDLYILDVLQQTIHKFSAGGQYDRNFHDQIMAASPLMSIRSFALDESRSILAVTDFLRGTLKLFLPDGREQKEIPLRNDEQGQLESTPTAVAIAPSGSLYVADSPHGILHRLDEAGVVSSVHRLDERALREAPFCVNMFCDAAGFLFLGDLQSQSILACDGTGVLKGVFHTGPDSLTPNISMNCFDVRSDGALLVLDSLRFKIHTLQFQAV
ncbi:MAG TPA: hypothetical protein PLB62_08210 [Candidatus Sumerlaeota bacterium]|nr:hypothetical protein [Candidatus Sumerlaeota bacterium]